MNVGSAKRAEKAGAGPRRRDEARALFRDAILRAAEEVFAEKGFFAARIQDIALAARVGVGTVYNHFEQKEDVLVALLDERTGELLALLDRRASDGKTFEEQLIARVARVLHFVDEHRSYFAVALEHGVVGAKSASADAALHGHKVKSLERTRKAVKALVDEGIEEGALAPIDRAYLARAFGSFLRAFIVTALEEKRNVEPEAALLVQLFLHGAAKKARSKGSTT